MYNDNIRHILENPKCAAEIHPCRLKKKIEQGV